jgi:hypothetical protein
MKRLLRSIRDDRLAWLSRQLMKLAVMPGQGFSQLRDTSGRRVVSLSGSNRPKSGLLNIDRCVEVRLASAQIDDRPSGGADWFPLIIRSCPAGCYLELKQISFMGVVSVQPIGLDLADCSAEC